MLETYVQRDPRTAPQIERLTHVGLYVSDIERSIAFYHDVLGLHVTDDDRAHGLVFLSSIPDDEHHEVLLTTGRTVPLDAKLLQQISFRCRSLGDVIGFWRRFTEQGVKILYTVTHGNAISCYFHDPDDNICEVYWNTGLKARQGFIALLDFEKSELELMNDVYAIVAEHGATGYIDGALLVAQGIGPG
jgi:catechol 2,3-dioxygenase-like lactoylglutathione lyase family enzyme